MRIWLIKVRVVELVNFVRLMVISIEMSFAASSEVVITKNIDRFQVRQLQDRRLSTIDQHIQRQQKHCASR